MDLSTTYLGLELKNPLIAGASPLSRSLDSCRELEDAGAAAIVMYSLFQEQIEYDSVLHDHYMSYGAESYAESLSYMPHHVGFPRGPDEYLEHLSDVKQAVDIPVIASLNGTSVGGWVEHAKQMQDAGADGVELNVYYVAADPEITGKEVEDRHLEILEAVKKEVTIPVAMKLGPYFSALANFANRLDDAGVDGLVLFNRFYQPDIDLELLEIVSDLQFSAPHEMRLPLRWIAILDAQIEASLAATTGVYTSSDVLKLMMAGADAAMLCATLLRNGIPSIKTILSGMREWMEDHEYQSIRQMQGSMNQVTCPNSAAFERGNYMRELNEFRPFV